MSDATLDAFIDSSAGLTTRTLSRDQSSQLLAAVSEALVAGPRKNPAVALAQAIAVVESLFPNRFTRLEVLSLVEAVAKVMI